MPDFTKPEAEAGLWLGVQAWRPDDPELKSSCREDGRVPAASTIRLYIPAALMTSGCSDPRLWPDSPGLLALSRLNAIPYRHLLEEQ